MATETNKIELEIVTPKGSALRVSVDEVTAPSVEGEFGVLPGHLPLLAALRTGLVTYRQGTESKRCAVGPGFAEAEPDRLALITDRYIEREQIDPVLVRRELSEVQSKIAAAEALMPRTGTPRPSRRACRSCAEPGRSPFSASPMRPRKSRFRLTTSSSVS